MHAIPVTAEFRHVLNGWCRQRGLRETREGWLSSWGFVAINDEGIPCAVEYLYVTGAKAFVDDLHSNPSASKADRALGINVAVGACIDLAKEIGCKFVVGFAASDRVLRKLHGAYGDEAFRVFPPSQGFLVETEHTDAERWDAWLKKEAAPDEL